MLGAPHMPGHFKGLWGLSQSRERLGEILELSPLPRFVRVPALPATICVTTLICVTFSVPWFPHSSNHNNNRTNLIHGAVERTNVVKSSPSVSSYVRRAPEPSRWVAGWDCWAWDGSGCVKLSTGRG